MSDSDLLLLAYSLAILTYNLGTLIYALPIPIKNLKKWGVNMMLDGISAALLISSFTLLINFANYMLTVLDANWSSFYSWISGRTALILTAFTALTYINTFLKAPYFTFLTSPINIVLGYLSMALSAIKVQVFLGSFILNYYKYLVLLGVLLYSLPFRLGKNAGAYLISFALVFYICLPLMPVFVEMFQIPTTIAGIGSIEISGYVNDYLGNPIPNAVINIYNVNHELVGSILSDYNGKYVLGDGYDLLPNEFNYSVQLELYGLTFYVVPKFIDSGMCGSSRQCVINLSVPGIVTASNGKLLVVRDSNIEVINAEIHDGLIAITLKSYGDGKIVLVYPSSVNLRELIADDSSRECENTYNLQWLGVYVNVCEVIIGNGVHAVEIHYEGGYSKPSFNERRIFSVENLTDVVVNLITLGIGLLFSLAFIPSLYLTLLLSISMSVARILGGKGMVIKLM